MCNDIDQMVTRCQSIYSSEEDIPIPYQQAKNALRYNDVSTFVQLMQSLVASVPYNVHKEHLDEGYFHTIIHVITSVLGMSPVSEMETSDGRIDMEKLYRRVNGDAAQYDCDKTINMVFTHFNYTNSELETTEGRIQVVKPRFLTNMYVSTKKDYMEILKQMKIYFFFLDFPSNLKYNGYRKREGALFK